MEYDENIIYKVEPDKVLSDMGMDLALEMLDEMLLIRHFETRGEQSYWTISHLSTDPYWNTKK